MEHEVRDTHPGKIKALIALDSVSGK